MGSFWGPDYGTLRVPFRVAPQRSGGGAACVPTSECRGKADPALAAAAANLVSLETEITTECGSGALRVGAATRTQAGSHARSPRQDPVPAIRRVITRARAGLGAATPKIYAWLEMQRDHRVSQLQSRGRGPGPVSLSAPLGGLWQGPAEAARSPEPRSLQRSRARS